MRQAAAARITTSSLNAIRSSRLPPPRAMISTSGRGSAAPGDETIEPHDRVGDAGGGAFALHRDRPEQDRAREAAGDGGADILQHRALRRGDDAHHRRQQRDRALAFGVEQALGGQALLQELDPREQRAGAGIFHPLDDELVGGALAIGGDAAGGDHLDPVLGHEPEARDGALPDHAGDLGRLVLEAEIDVAGGVALEFGDLAAHAHPAERALERALHRPGDFRDRVFRHVRAGIAGRRHFVHHASLC